MMPRGVSGEVLAHQLGEALVGNDAGAEGVDRHRDRLGHADGVGQLHFAARLARPAATMFLAM